MSFFKKIDLPWDVGLLVIRLGIGASMFIFHGYAKITGGTGLWEKIGANMKLIGVDFLPVFWGFMASLSESAGSLFILLGIFFRPSSALLAFTMLIAALRHLHLPAGADGAGWSGASHALELLSVYVGLFFLGPGKYVVTIRR